MNSDRSRSVSVQIFIIIGLVAVASMFFKYASAVYKDYQVETEIKNLESSIVNLQEENLKLEKLLEYLDTDAYKEIIAKSELNLRRPREIVIAIKEEQNVEKKDLEVFLPDSNYTSIPIYRKWLRAFME